MGFAVLGPFEVRVGGTPVAVRGVKERRLLALLVSRVGETVAVDDIVDALWADQPPTGAAKSVHVHVARVRAALAGYREDGRPVVERRGAGYVLAVPPVETDSGTFVALVERARAAAGADAPDIAARLLREALGLWRGAAYADFRDTAFGRAEAARWEELRLRAVEERIDADLALGRHGDVTGELEALVAEHPLRERFWGQLMVALYRGGRQADALSAFRRVRALLADQLGIEPSPELVTLEGRILAQDPQLAPPDVAAIGPPPLPPPLARPAPVLLGRDRELAALRDRWDAAERGCGGLVIVTGAPGSGRSTVVAELARHAHTRGAVVGLVALGDLPADPRAARALARPHLLVVDDADGADPDAVEPEVLDAVRRAVVVAREVARLLVVVADEGGARGEELAGVPAATRLRLDPLSTADARGVVRHLLGDPAAPDVVDRIVADGCGLPGRLHSLAVQHLEREAAERVSVGAAQAPAARRALSHARATVRTSVLDLQQARRLRDASGSLPVAFCPYKGLARFEPQDSAIFHGREHLVAALVARLVDTTLVAVVGPSGAGKSSLVRAGLLPALADGVLPGSEHWARRITRPGGTPRKNLAAALDGTDRSLVLVVDQFEELFVGGADATEIAGFVGDLLALVDRDTSEAARRIVLTVRADHLGDCAAHPALAAALAESTVLVPAMTEAELRRVVEGPAEYAGLTVEPALLDAVVSDVAGRPGALPLLSTALLDTWERRRDRTLTEAGYLAAGGVSGALARLAERAFAQLAPDEQRAARRILLRLAETGGAGAPVARRVPVDEVAPADDGPARRALDVLAARRLLTLGEASGSSGGTIVEVAHEALLAHWPRLVRWLEDDEQGRTLRRHLAPAAREWAAAGRPDAELYRGTRLQAAWEWAASHEDDLQAVEREFLVAGRQAADRELREQRDRADREARARRRLRSVLIAVVALLALAASTAAVAVRQTDAARVAERSAEARRLGALALTEPDLDRSLLLAAAAMRGDDSPETEGDVLAALLRSPHALGQARAARRLQDLALSPDGGTIAVPDNLGTVTFFDARTMRPSQPPTSLGLWTGHVAFSPDGRLLAVLASPDAGGNDVVIWDVAARRVLRRLAVPPRVAAESPGRPAWTADARMVAVGSDSGTLFLDEVASGVRRTVRIPGARAGHPIDAYTAGRLVVAVPEGTRTAFTVDPATAAVRSRVRLPVSADHVGVDRTGSRIAVSDEAGDVYVVGVSASAARQMQGKHTGRVWGMIFSGDSLASFGDDAIVLIRDARSGQRLLSLAGHTGRILGAAFSADGGELWTSALDRSVIAWDLTGRRSLGVTSSTGPTGPFPDAQGALHVAWSRDRTRAVAVWSDGLAAALDTTTGAIGPGDRFPGRIGDVALSPDGARAFLTVMDPATLRTVVQRWDVARRRSDGSVDPGPDFIEGSVDLSPDGRVLAVGTFDDEVFKRRTPLYLVDPGTLQTLGAPLDVLPSPLVAFSPDGRSLAVASATAAGIAVLDVPTRRVRWLDSSVSQAHVVAFSPDGTRLGVGSEQGVVAVYDAASGARVAGPAQVQPGIVTTTTFSPDGRRLLTTGADGLVRLWQPADLRPLATSLFTPDNVGRNATFTPDGSSILVVDHTGRFTSWDARPQAWLRRACSIADRDFTSEERARYAITADSPEPCP